MAEIQIGGSSVQVAGIHVPVVNAKLAEGEGLYAHHEKVLWVDGAKLENHKVGGGFRAGKVTVVKATGPGRVGFSDNHPGEVIAIPLAGDGRAWVNGHHLLLASANLDYKHEGTTLWYQTVKRGSDGPEYENHFPAMPFQQEFAATDGKPGLLMVHAKGNVFVRDLADGEGIDIGVHALLAWTGGRHKLKFQAMHLRTGAHRDQLICTHLTGPGRVWIQSGSSSEEFVEELKIDNHNKGIQIG